MTDSEKEKQSPNQSEELADLGGPTAPDVFFTFLGAGVLFVISYLISIFSDWPRAIPPIFSILVFATFLFGSWCCACWNKSYEIDTKTKKKCLLKKWLLCAAKWYAEFGTRLWHFPGLWYVVFLVGLYITGISNLLQYADQSHQIDTHQIDTQIDTTKLLLSGMQNAITVTFLAVITSVLAHTFTSIGKLTRDFKSAVVDSGVAAKKAQSMAEKLKNMSQEIDLLNSTLKIGARSRRTSERIYAISDSAREIERQDESMAPMTQTVLAMCENVEKYHDVALHPLLAPGVEPPMGAKAEDTVAQIAEKLQGNEAPHYAYMSAAIGRYFEGEITERQFPGILLHVTSYAYYIRTVDKIVHALEPWWDRFEFYTLMPRPPLELFRFANSQDIVEWRKFLNSYYKFQSKNRGIWKRYFAYTAKDEDLHNGFVPIIKIGGSVRKGYVLTDKDSWLPRKISSGDEVDKCLPYPAVDPEKKSRIIKENPFHDGIGTLATIFENDLSDGLANLGWRKLVDVLLEYHGLQENASNDDIDERFIYRSVDDCKDLFDIPIKISTRRTNPIKVTRSFKIPADFFAIRDTIRDTKEKKPLSSWRFLIGLDSGLQQDTTDTNIQLAFAPVLDLTTMAHEHSGDINNKAATFVREKLHDIFLDINDTNSKTHNQIINMKE